MALARPAAIAALVGVLATAAGFSLRAARAREPSRLDAVLDVPSIPSSAEKVLSLGFRSVLADLDYLQAVQVFGDRSLLKAAIELKQRHALVVYRLLDYATDLDSRFDYAYIFGANSITVPTLDGNVLNLDEVVALLRKGAANGSTDYRIPFYLAYFLSSYAGDIRGAAVAMAEAARRPKHPAYLPFLATRLAAAGGAIDTGIQLAQAMAAQAETDDLRAQFEERVRLLLMERDLRMLESAVGSYAARRGRPPTRLTDLVDDGLLRALPQEPHGGSYLLDARTGRLSSSAAPRLKLYDDTERQSPTGDGP